MVLTMNSNIDEKLRAQLEAESKEVERLITELSKKESIIDALIELLRT